MEKKTIVVFTGGGLAPALNPTLYGVIEEAKKQNFRILGGMFGWASLLENGKLIDLTNVDVSAIQSIGGTFLRSSRTNPFVVPNGVEQIKTTMAKEKIDYIVAVGGNDTMGVAHKLFTEENIPIIGVPKTVDNDLSETYWTPGYPTAAHYLAKFTEEIKKDAAYSLSRIFVIESIGAEAGWLATAAAFGDADVIIPPEKEVSLDKTLQLIQQRYQDNGGFATVVVGQEAQFDKNLETIHDDQKDQFKVKRNSFVCLALRDKIKSFVGDIAVKALYPGNFLQTGNPIEIDRKLATELGAKAVELVEKNDFGKMVCLIRPDKEKNDVVTSSVELNKTVEYRALPDEYFDWDNLQATQAFFDYLEPALGKYEKQKDDSYYQLIKKINQ